MRVMVKAKNGRHVWIPQEKLSQWKESQNAPMTPEREKVVQEIYQKLRGEGSSKKE